jgi:V/A-type H+/Na+-transporting ATPase subunit E
VSLEAILDAIRASGAVAVAEIQQQARDEAGTILAEARTEAEKVRRAACTRTALPAQRERARIIHRARLLHLRTVGDAREAAIDAALGQARRCLAAGRSDPRYPAVLRRLTEEALAELEGSLEDVARARLEADPRDEALLARLLGEQDLSVHVNYELDCWGGLIARSEDGRIVVINTLESRLERATPFLRRYLAALFAGGEGVRPASITETLAYEQ